MEDEAVSDRAAVGSVTMPGQSERKHWQPRAPCHTATQLPRGTGRTVAQQSYPQQGEHTRFLALPLPTNLVSRTGSSTASSSWAHEPCHMA